MEIFLLRELCEGGERMIKVDSSGRVYINGVPRERVIQIYEHLMLGVHRG